MAASIVITGQDHTAAGLRRAATRTRDANAARRMLALSHILDVKTRGEAARLCGMERQTLRDRVHRYNREGLAGLCDRVSPGAPRRLSPDQERQVAQWVRRGPDLAVHGVVRWRRVDLGRMIAQQFGVTLAERSVGAVLRRPGLRRLSVRPRSPEQDAAAQEAHEKTLPNGSLPVSRAMPKASRSNSGGRTKPASASKAR